MVIGEPLLKGEGQNLTRKLGQSSSIFGSKDELTRTKNDLWWFSLRLLVVFQVLTCFFKAHYWSIDHGPLGGDGSRLLSHIPPLIYQIEIDPSEAYPLDSQSQVGLLR